MWFGGVMFGRLDGCVWELKDRLFYLRWGFELIVEFKFEIGCCWKCIISIVIVSMFSISGCERDLMNVSKLI